MRKILFILLLLPFSGHSQYWAKILLGNGDTMRVQIVRNSSVDTTMYGICDTNYYYASRHRVDSIASAQTTAIAGKQAAGSYVLQSTTVNNQALSGNVTVTTISGNAGTATALQNARTINGTSFDGTGNITVTAAAGTLTGTTLASGVTGSSLTSFGSSPTFVTPILGTPTSGTLTNCTFPTLNQNTTGSAASLTTARTINGTSFDGTGNITVTAAASTLTGSTLASGVTASSLTSTGTLASLIIGAGSTSITPLKLTSGTVNTTAVAGGVEYDGTAFYASSAASSRQVAVTDQFISLTADYTLTDNNTAQKAFNATTNGQVTVQASTSYEIEGTYYITNTGTTSHTWAVLLAGTATFTSGTYLVTASTGTGNAIRATSNIYTTTPGSALVITAASTSATENVEIFIKGIIRVNAGGTIIPQVKLSASTTGTEKVLTNSYFKLHPIGTNTVTNVGNWN